MVRNIRDNLTLNEGDINDNANKTRQAQAQPEGAGVPRQIRTPSICRSNEVADNGGSGDNGSSGPDAGQTPQGLGRQTKQKDGHGNGWLVRQERWALSCSSKRL